MSWKIKTLIHHTPVRCAMTTPTDLVSIARESEQNAYNPYSDYAVGAVLLTKDGTVYKGVNMENVTLDMGSHAERTGPRLLMDTESLSPWQLVLNKRMENLRLVVADSFLLSSA